MERLDRNGDRYRTYVKKLTEQESALEQLRSRLLEIDAQEAEAKQAVAELTATLNAE